MIKICIIILVFTSGHWCRVIPDEVSKDNHSEERTVTISSDGESKDADSENTHLSIEIRSEEEKIANPEKTDEFEEGKAGDLEEKVIKTRSAEESKAADSESTDESVIETRTGESDRTANSENPEFSTRTGETTEVRNGNGDDVTSNLRKREESSYSTEVRSDELDNNSPQLRLGAVDTETLDRQDASHILTKEQKQGSPEENIEEEYNQRNDNKVKSKSASQESDSKTVSDGESKSVNEELQEKAANPEDDSRSSVDVHQDNAKSGADVGDEGILRSGKDLLQPELSRRMFNQDFNIGDDKVERSDTYEAADTRMGARDEDTSASGHQVHNNYFGGSRSSQSQYPYTPLENLTPAPFLPLSFSNELPSVPNIFRSLSPPHPPATQKSGNPFIPAQNSLDNNQNFNPFLPIPSLKSSELLRPLPPLESNGKFRLPPLNHHLQPSQPYQEQTPSWKPECFNCNNPPSQNLQTQPFQNLQPQQLQNLLPQPVQNFQPPQPFQNLQPQPFQNLQQFPRFQRLLPPLPQPQNLMTTLQPFGPSQNPFSMLRQAMPEASHESSSVFSRNWSTSSQENPFAVRTSVKQSSFTFS